MSIVRVLARPMLASTFIISGLDRMRHADATAAELAPLLGKAAAALPVQLDEKTLARALGGIQVGAGVLLATGKVSRLAGTVLALTSALNALVEYRTSDGSTKEGKAHRRGSLLKNISLTGGALLAAVDTAGRPGLAWRANQLATAGKKAGTAQLKHTDAAVRRLAHNVAGA
ncbi:DoxX family protein [Pseudarthrobacter sp. P1]|uniref:DoxX family protein n=1 Tax=Pseudarthrobacter sp. P1 TaxID=3418418 RepID=UPI003CE8ACCC